MLNTWRRDWTIPKQRNSLDLLSNRSQIIHCKYTLVPHFTYIIMFNFFKSKFSTLLHSKFIHIISKFLLLLRSVYLYWWKTMRIWPSPCMDQGTILTSWETLWRWWHILRTTRCQRNNSSTLQIRLVEDIFIRIFIIMIL